MMQIRIFQAFYRQKTKMQGFLLQYAKGFTSIEMLCVLGVVVQLLVLFGVYSKQSMDSMLDTWAVIQMKTIEKGTWQYVKVHLPEIIDALQASATQDGSPADPVEITLDSLISEGFLPSHEPKTNVYQQTVRIVISFYDTSNLDGIPGNGGILLKIVLLTTDGEALSTPHLRSIAMQLGLFGGYVTKEKPETIIGSFEGWTDSSTSCPIPPEPGHFLLISYFSGENTLAAESFLHRLPLKNSGQLNVMRTPLGIDQTCAMQFLDPDKESIDLRNTDRTTLSSEKLIFGKGCEITKEYLQLQDAEGNTVKLTPKQLLFSSQGENGEDLSCTLDVGQLKIDDATTERTIYLHPLGLHLRKIKDDEYNDAGQATEYIDLVISSKGASGLSGKVNTSYLHIGGPSLCSYAHIFGWGAIEVAAMEGFIYNGSNIASDAAQQTHQYVNNPGSGNNFDMDPGFTAIRRKDNINNITHIARLVTELGAGYPIHSNGACVPNKGYESANLILTDFNKEAYAILSTYGCQALYNYQNTDQDPENWYTNSCMSTFDGDYPYLALIVRNGDGQNYGQARVYLTVGGHRSINNRWHNGCFFYSDWSDGARQL